MELIFVHGALVRDGAWWWQRAATLLFERTGIRSRAVGLPSCGEGDARDVHRGLVADAEALRRELDDVDDAIVVGHSYGGTVIAESGHHPAVRHLVYISSYLPDIGQAQATIMGGEKDPVAVSGDGEGMLSLSGYDASTFGERFLADADIDSQREAFGRVAAQAVEAFVTPTSADGWRGADSTYLICGRDRSTSIELQRFHADRATRSVELPTGHHPFISRPDLVVDCIQDLVLAGRP